MKKRTLVIGASLNPIRYSHIAIKRLRESGVETLAIGVRKGTVADVTIETEKKPFSDIDTVTLYLNPERQTAYYDYILSLKPRRVIFNPGTENTAFMKILKDNTIEAEIACTLVLLSTNQF